MLPAVVLITIVAGVSAKIQEIQRDVVESTYYHPLPCLDLDLQRQHQENILFSGERAHHNDIG